MTDVEKSIQVYQDLSAPIPVDEIKLKVQTYNQDKSKGMVVAYIDARVVADRLNSVLGAFGWGDKYEDLVMSDTNWKARCLLSIYDDDGREITRSDIGEASAKQKDDENVAKSAHSDAFKRAAVKFGIGRELYALPRIWVELEQKGKSYVIKDDKAARRKLFAGDASSNGAGSGEARAEQSKSRANALASRYPRRAGG